MLALYFKRWKPGETSSSRDVKIGVDWWILRGRTGKFQRCGGSFFWLGYALDFTLVKRRDTKAYERDMEDWKGTRLL